MPLTRATVTRNCDHCGVEYQARIDSLAAGMGRNCSRSCGFAARKARRIKRMCIGCGIEFEIIPSKLKAEGGGRYCTDACCRANRYTKRPVADRFWEKVDIKGPDECWPWQAAAGPRGYGKFGLCSEDNKTVMATHVAWELTNGPIPDGLWALHKCDNPPCCNPAHLFLGTNRDNVDDKVSKGRQRKGETAPTAKFSSDAVAELRRRWAAGEPLPGLAEEFNMHYQTAYKITRGKRRNYDG